jgi:hypothetical protein
MRAKRTIGFGADPRHLPNIYGDVSRNLASKPFATAVNQRAHVRAAWRVGEDHSSRCSQLHRLRMLRFEPVTFNHGVEGSSPSALTNNPFVQPGDMGNGAYLRHG